MGLENLMELQILIEGIDHFTEPFRQMESTIAGAEAKFKSINSTMKLMGKSKSEIDSINSSLRTMADQKAFSNIASDLGKIGMAKSDIEAMEQSYMRMAQYQRDMAKAQENYAAGKDLAMSGAMNLTTGALGAAGIFEMVKKAGEFQSNMAVIQDSTGATTKQMQAFGDSVMNASANVSKFNDLQMAEIAQTLTSGGFGNVKQAQSLLLPTAKYAEVQMYEHKASDPIEATKQAIEMAHVFGNYDPKSFENFLNNFNKYSMMQPGDSSALAQTLTFMAPTANTMHMKQSDVMALAAIDNVIGLTGSHGGTNSADMIMRLIPGLIGGGPTPVYSGSGKHRHLTGYKTPKAWGAMEQLGFIDQNGNSKFFNKNGSIKDLNGLLGTIIGDSKKFNPEKLTGLYKDIFGIQGGRAAMLLSNPRSLEQLGKMRTQLGKTKNMDQINKDLQATPEGQLNLLGSNSMTLMLRLGQQLAISLNPAIAQVNKLLSSMLKFSQAHPQVAKLIGDFALFAVGGKIAEGVVKLFLGNFKMLSAAFKMFKITTAAGELTKFGRIVSGLRGTFNNVSIGVRMFVGSLGSGLMTGIKAAGSALKVFGSGALSVIKVLGTFAGTLLKLGATAAKWAIEVAADWLIAMGPVGWIIAGVTAIIGAGVALWMTNFGGFRDKLTSLWNDVTRIATRVWNGLTNFFRQWGTTLLAIFVPVIGLPILLSQHWNQITAIASKIWNGMRVAISNAVNGAANNVKSILSNMAADAYNFGANFIKMLANGIMGGIGAVESAASRVMNKVKGFFGFHSPTKEGPGSEADQWMPNMMNMFVEGIQSHIPKLQSTLSQALGSPFQVASASIGHNISQNIAYPGSSGYNAQPTIIVYASGNITKNERDLGDIISRQIWDKAKRQGKF